MITLTKSGNAIVFTFDDNDHYLNDGTIEVPVNSLTLVTDDSQMATFRKAASNDIFISATYDELGMSKADLETFYKENMVGSTGGSGSGVTEEWVEEYVSESISGKADTSDVQNVASDVATVSGDVNTLSGSVNALTGAVNTLSGDVSTLSGSVDSNHNAITAVVGDVQTLSGDVANKADTTAVTASINSAVSGKMDTSAFNTYSASTDARLSEDEETTAAALNALDDSKQDTLIAGTNITISGNVISAAGGNNVIELTQAQYDALTDVDPDAFYIITDADGGATTGQVQTMINTAIATKQDTLVAGTNITISGNVISAEGGSIAVDQAFDRDSTNAIANSAVTRNTVGIYSMSWSGGKSIMQAYDQKGYSLNNLSLGFSRINNRDIVQTKSNIGGLTNFNLVETSAITSSVTSASTDSEIPSAKAVYDALQEGGGGLPESAFTTYTASTDARLAEDEEVTAAALNTLNDATASNTTALGGLKLVSLTQAQYDALATKDASTLYIITGSN